MTDLIFLKALRDKLKGGNIRSIHLNVLPGRFASRLDLGNLNYANTELADKFLDLILTNPCFEFKISFDGIDLNAVSEEEKKQLGLLSKRLNSINIENDDNYKEHGIRTFGFGFPILIKVSKQDPKKIIKAPLFIWQLEILKATNKINSWTILRNKQRNENGKIQDEEIHGIGLNEVLLSYLKSDENITIPQINEELLEDAIIDRNELVDQCCKVLTALNGNSSNDIKESLFNKFHEPVKNIPEASTLESISGNTPWIYFGGVFGLFRTQKESIITDIDRIIEGFNDFEFENLKGDFFSGTTQSAIDTDPSQQEILRTLTIEQKKIIQGPPGTGKSQSLTALITNALANNLKCLVVCEKKTALDVIKNNLHKENEQLGILAAVIEDISKAREGIVNSVRDRISNLFQSGNSNINSYENILKTTDRLAFELNEQHKVLEKIIYQDKTWTDLVGEFLSFQKVADSLELKAKLDFKEFKFQKDQNELSEIIYSIKTADRLFHPIKQFEHPLDILHDDLFKEEIPIAVQLKLEEFEKEALNNLDQLDSHLKKQIQNYQNWLKSFYQKIGEQITQIKKCLQTDLDEYRDWLDKHYDSYYHELMNKIKSLQEFEYFNREKFGETFFKNNALTNFKISLFSFFSKKFKELKSNKIKVREYISGIKEAHLKCNYFEHEYFEAEKSDSLKFYFEDILKLEGIANHWYARNKEIKEDLINAFASENLHRGFEFHKDKIVDSEKKFDEFVTYVEKDKLLAVAGKISSSHVKKINNLDLYSFQLKNCKQYEELYAELFSSNEIHELYESFRTDLIKSEESYNEIISKINGDKIFKRNSSSKINHNQKIGEIRTLILEIKTISDNLEIFREYFEWRKFFIELPVLHQKIIRSIIDSDCVNGETNFKYWYYNWLLAIEESILKYLPKNEDKIIELIEHRKELKKLQVRNIVANNSKRQHDALVKIKQAGYNPFSIFNKKGSQGQRRNSLRKIVNSYFELFTEFFPVVMVSPTVCSSIIPLKEGIFDIVIFDEASQLRLEDTYPALLRGKIKIISGDSQQMPPSNFFQGGSALLNPSDEDFEEEQSIAAIENISHKIDNSLDLADSESLLVYAENCNYKQSYLKIHYRSEHPFLIDFSNYAFYGKRLIPMPPKEEYSPIEFISVNGIYEDQVNRDEANKVIDLLINRIKPNKDGKYPSVGIATFNLYQRNLILEEITKIRQQSPEHDKKISDLGSDLFVKNLENIQGDERDIIILSTTFGKKSNGVFKQTFGPIIQNKGYKLLNVIVTRARHKIFVCCSIPNENISQYSVLLQNMKNTGRGIFYAYLAYAKSISEGNHEVRENILKQLYENCESRFFDVEEVYGSESPFEDEVYYRLAEKIGASRLKQQFKIGGFRIDLVIKSETSGKPIIAIECDGAKYHSSNEAYAWDIFRQSQLENQGFIFYRIWSTNWWHSEEKELRKLVEFIQSIDRKERKTIDPLEVPE